MEDVQKPNEMVQLANAKLTTNSTSKLSGRTDPSIGAGVTSETAGTPLNPRSPFVPRLPAWLCESHTMTQIRLLFPVLKFRPFEQPP